MDGRIRLRQWLEGRLNTGYIPGLVWLDKSKGIFKIPWKHHSKHTWQEDDAAIFKDWAVVTGRYREGLDVPDWPMWKTRLRCALNKAPDIQEVRQHHNLHCDEPFKVYRFISKTESMWRANATRHASLIFDGVPSGHHPHQQQLDVPQFYRANSSRPSPRLPTSQCQAQPRPPSSPCQVSRAVCKPITLIQKTGQGQIKLKYINIPLHRASRLGVPAVGAAPRLQQQQQQQQPRDPEDNTSSGGGCGGKMGLSASSVGHKVALYLPGCVSATPATVTAANFIDPKIKLSDVMEPEMHQICLRIQHLDQRVSDMIVNNPNGCCIYFGRFDENLSTAGPEPIEPQIYQYVTDSNKYCVDMLLDNMQRGVVLTILNGSIYAEKLCKCATFVYRPGNNGEFYFVDKLNRRDKMMIFNFRSFLEELHYFQRGLGDKPHVELILAFGQQIKENSSPESLYVWCRLASCKAWFLLQRALANQSSKPVLGTNHNNHNNHNNNSSSRKLCVNNNNNNNIIRDHIIIHQSHQSHLDPLSHRQHVPPNINNSKNNNNQSILDQSEEVVPEDLIEENVIDHMVYGENCLSDELGIIGVGHEVSIENVSEEFPSINFQSAFGSRQRFEENDLNYQFENNSNYDFK